MKHTALYGKTPHAVQGHRQNWQVSDGFGYLRSGGVRDGLGAYPQETQKFRESCVDTRYIHRIITIMVKTLTKHGNSYALVIDRAILELLQMDPERPVELTTDGNALTIRPMTEGTKGARVARSLKRVNDKHGKALKRLGE